MAVCVICESVNVKESVYYLIIHTFISGMKAIGLRLIEFLETFNMIDCCNTRAFCALFMYFICLRCKVKL